MKKFFMALLKGLGYLGIYLGVQIIVQYAWGSVKGIALTAEYAARGLNLSDPAVLEMYMEEAMQVAMDIVVPSTVVSNILAIGVTCLIFVCRKKKITKELSLRKFSAGAVVPIVMIGLGMNVLTNFVMGLLPEELLSSYAESSQWLSDDVGIMTVLLAVVLAPLAEEWFLRGLVFSRMRKGMPVIAAMLISSVAFGLLHGNLVWAAYAAVLGMMLAWTFERTKSLWAAILLHFSYNVCGMLLGLFPEDTPEWVGVALIAFAVVFTAVGIFLFVKTPKAEEPEEEVNESLQNVDGTLQ